MLMFSSLCRMSSRGEMFLKKKWGWVSGPPIFRHLPDLPPPGSRGVMGLSRGVSARVGGWVAMWAIPPL